MASYSEKKGEAESPSGDYLARAEKMRKDGDRLFSHLKGSAYGSTQERLLRGSLGSYQNALRSITDLRAKVRRERGGEPVEETFSYEIPRLKKDKEFSGQFISYLHERGLSKKEISEAISSPNQRGAMLFLDYEVTLLGPRVKHAETALNVLQRRQHAASKLESSVQNNAAGASRVIGAFSILTFLAALFFLSMNFTGAAIGSVSFSGTEWIGLVLVLAGIALALVYFRENNSRAAKKSGKRKK